MKIAKEKRNRKKIVKAAGISLGLLLIFYILLVNFLVSAALVPSFMEKLEAFERITEESYAAQVQTSDIKGNRQIALNETKEWLETAEHKKLSVETEDGYRWIAEELPAGNSGAPEELSAEKPEIEEEASAGTPEEISAGVLEELSAEKRGIEEEASAGIPKELSVEKQGIEEAA